MEKEQIQEKVDAQLDKSQIENIQKILDLSNSGRDLRSISFVNPKEKDYRVVKIHGLDEKTFVDQDFESLEGLEVVGLQFWDDDEFTAGTFKLMDRDDGMVYQVFVRA